MKQLLTLGASFLVSWSVDQFALKFHRVKMCFGCIDCVDIEIAFKLSFLPYIRHAQTSLLDNCAGGTQGVQLLDG